MGVKDGDFAQDERGPHGAEDVQPSGTVATNAADVPWSPHQLRIFRWLCSEAPALAPVYEAAVRMARDLGFPGRVWFMAHALRDIRNRLPNAIAGPEKHSNTEYSHLVKVICEHWEEDGHTVSAQIVVGGSGEPPSEGPSRVEISAELFSAVGELVVGHNAIGPRKEANARRLFRALSGQTVPDYVVKSWITNTNKAERFAHLRDKPLTQGKVREFEEIFDACEQALAAMANRSYENMDGLDEILAAANS